MNERQPAVRRFDAGDIRVCVRVLESLPDAHKPKSHDEKAKWRVPRSEGMGDDLEQRSEGKHRAEVEILAEMRVGKGCKQPAEKIGAIST